MLAAHGRLGLTARLLAAFLVGALLCVGYFLGRWHAGIFPALPVAVGLWVLTLRATPRLSVPWPIQVLLMVAGFITAGVTILAVALHNLEMD